MSRTSCACVDNAADLNSYISEIQVPIYADDPMAEAVVQASYMLTICDRLAEERERVREIDLERALVMERYRERMYLAMVGMINATTQRMLKDSSKHTTLHGTKGAELPIMQHAAKAPGIAVGQWVNLAKNRRLASIEYATLGLCMDVPRPLITTNVVLRLMYITHDPYALAKGQMMHSVGGVLTLEHFKMVEQPIQVRTWKMHKVEKGQDEAIQVEYGVVDPDSGLREKVPLVHLMCLIPPDVLLPTVTGAEPRVGRYIASQQAYTEGDISKVRLYHGIEARELLCQAASIAAAKDLLGSHERVWDQLLQENSDPVLLTFYTHWIGSFALLQKVASHIPYLSTCAGAYTSLSPPSSPLPALSLSQSLTLTYSCETLPLGLKPHSVHVLEHIPGEHRPLC